MGRDLFLTIDFPPATGGVARYYESVLSALHGRQVTVLTVPAHEVVNTLPDRICVVRKQLVGPTWLWPRWLPLLWHALRIVVRERPGLVHVGQLLPVGTVALIVKRLYKIPYIVYTHGLDVLLASDSTRKRSLARSVLHHADLVICNSTATQSLLLRLGVPEQSILIVKPGCTLIHTPLDAARVEALRSTHQLTGKKVILSVGRLVKRKGMHIAIDAMAQILREIPNVVLVIVGDGPERSVLEARAQKAGVHSNIRFVGGVHDSELPAWYALCDVFLLVPSALQGNDIEGFGIVYLEAASFGKPAVGSKTGGVPEAVQDGITGLLVPSDDPAATAHAVRKLLQDHQLAAQLGATARRTVETEATWEKRTEGLRHWLAPRRQS